MPLLAALLLVAAPVPAPQADVRAALEVLRGYDARLAAIGWRLATANRALCRRLAPTPGWALHALGQYGPEARDAARASFGFALPVAVELVVPGSPAAAAGVTADDSLAAVAGRALPDAASSRKASSRDRDAAAALVAEQPVDAPLAVTLVRGGVSRDVAIAASPGCRSAFEVLAGDGLSASSDGAVVQVGERFLRDYRDEEIAVIVAHELAHTILAHRARLDAAGVKRGLLKEFGRNARLFRRTEDDADRLAVALLYNAGYDPASAAAFWREHGGLDGGLFRSRTHGSTGARAALSSAAAAAIPAGAARPFIPPVLATRDEPL